MVCDANGSKLRKGDVVAPLRGDLRGKICDLRRELGTAFVRIRPAHRPYDRGVWYAADHVQLLQRADPPRPAGSSPPPARRPAGRRPARN